MKTILKKIYKSLPFKKEIYSLIRSIYSPPNSIYKHLHFNGPFLVKIDDTRAFKMTHFGFYIENEIFWNGLYNGWEKFSLKIWSEMCEGSEVILDIGANTGIYALIGKTISP
ncbi:MAG: methyltransferase, partial [Saprospiraceae bacterium]|nr:methyltransferase [Saprospiraceae bacterium]